MKSVTRFITVKFRLKLNKEKSTVSRPWLDKFLGYTFIKMCGKTKIRIHRKTIERFKKGVRELAEPPDTRSVCPVVWEGSSVMGSPMGCPGLNR